MRCKDALRTRNSLESLQCSYGLQGHCLSAISKDQSRSCLAYAAASCFEWSSKQRISVLYDRSTGVPSQNFPYLASRWVRNGTQCGLSAPQCNPLVQCHTHGSKRQWVLPYRLEAYDLRNWKSTQSWSPSVLFSLVLLSIFLGYLWAPRRS